MNTRRGGDTTEEEKRASDKASRDVHGFHMNYFYIALLTVTVVKLVGNKRARGVCLATVRPSVDLLARALVSLLGQPLGTPTSQMPRINLVTTEYLRCLLEQGNGHGVFYAYDKNILRRRNACKQKCIGSME